MNLNHNGLAKRAQQGDQGAFIEIYNLYQRTIYSYVLFRVGDSNVAEDLCAEVFVRMVDHIQTYTDQGRPFLSWLYTIAHHLVIDYYRKRKTEVWVALEDNYRDNDRQPHPLLIAEGNLDRKTLAHALQSLTDEQQQVIFLKFIEDMTNSDIARMLNKTEGAVKSLQHRALVSLRTSLQKEHAYEPEL